MNDSFKVVSDYISIPENIYYVKNFIDANEERCLIDNVLSSPKPKWTVLSNRRLQNWGGLPHPKGMVRQQLPQWLEKYALKLSQMNAFGGNTANHVLINEYLSGQGIMPHEDGPLFYPTVATINTGSHTLLDFYTKNSQTIEGDADPNPQRIPVFSILLEPRSLVISQRDAYESYLHGIREVKSDVITDRIANLYLCDSHVIGEELERSTRFSFTIRFVPKVVKNLLFLK